MPDAGVSSYGQIGGGLGQLSNQIFNPSQSFQGYYQPPSQGNGAVLGTNTQQPYDYSQARSQVTSPTPVPTSQGNFNANLQPQGPRPPQGGQPQQPNGQQQQRINGLFPGQNPYTTYMDVPGRGQVKVSDLQNEGYFQGQQTARPDQIPDYQSIIQPTLDALQGGVGSAQSAFGAAQAGIQSNVQQSQNTVNEQEQAALNSAQTQQQGLTSQEQNQEALQRQAASDSVRGIQAQFGGSSSAGGYLGEQAYRSGIQNVQQLQTGLQNATAQINNQIANVHNVTQKALQDIDSQASAQTAAAQNQLSQQLQQLRMATGMIQSQKAQMAAQHIENYQQYVRSIDAQNSQIKANLAIEQQRAQDLLALYGQRVSGAMQNLKSVTLPNGQKGSFDQQSGMYLNANGEQVDANGNVVKPAAGTGTSAAAGGGQLNNANEIYKNQAAGNIMNASYPATNSGQQQQPPADINSLTPDQSQRMNSLGFGGSQYA